MDLKLDFLRVTQYLLGINQHCGIWPSVVTQMVYFKMGKCKTGKADHIWEDRAYINVFVRGINFQWFIILLVQYIAQKYTSLFAKAAQLPLEEWGLFLPPLCYKDEQMLSNTSLFYDWDL